MLSGPNVSILKKECVCVCECAQLWSSCKTLLCDTIASRLV